MKFECPTYLKSKGKAMAVTHSDGEVSDDELECDEDGNFITFTATAVVNESISVRICALKSYCMMLFMTLCCD